MPSVTTVSAPRGLPEAPARRAAPTHPAAARTLTGLYRVPTGAWTSRRGTTP